MSAKSRNALHGTTYEQVIEATLQKWRDDGAHFKVGASPEKIKLFEDTYSVAMPADLKDYFMRVDGMGDSEFWETDHEQIAFWALPDRHELAAAKDVISHVAPLPAIWDSAPETLRDYFVIGDWSILCFVFCARMTRKPSETSEIFHYDGGNPQLLAHSYHQFLEQYLQQGIHALFPK